MGSGLKSYSREKKRMEQRAQNALRKEMETPVLPGSSHFLSGINRTQQLEDLDQETLEQLSHIMPALVFFFRRRSQGVVNESEGTNHLIVNNFAVLIGAKVPQSFF